MISNPIFFLLLLDLTRLTVIFIYLASKYWTQSRTTVVDSGTDENGHILKKVRGPLSNFNICIFRRNFSLFFSVCVLRYLYRAKLSTLMTLYYIFQYFVMRTFKRTFNKSLKQKIVKNVSKNPDISDIDRDVIWKILTRSSTKIINIINSINNNNSKIINIINKIDNNNNKSEIWIVSIRLQF